MDVLLVEKIVQFVTTKMSRLWQNIIYQKCPDCDTRLAWNGKGYVCPSHCGFFITKASILKIISDPTHYAVRFASQQQREYIDVLIANSLSTSSVAKRTDL